jgi:hypothetical protein
MSLFVPQASEDLMLQNILNKTAPQNQILKLFKSNTTPGESDIASTYTEADFTGYSSASLTGSSWSIVDGNPTVASYAQQTFTSTADQTAQNIYGYFVVQASSGLLLWSERFTNGPYVIANNGDAIKVTPKLSLD